MTVVYRRRRTPRRGRRGRSSSFRRPTVWVRSFKLNVPDQGGGNHALDLLDGADIDRGAVVGSTIVRVRSNVGISGVDTNVPPLPSGFFIGVAIGQVGGPFPIPGTDRNTIDWMWWKYYSIIGRDVGYNEQKDETGVLTGRYMAVDLDVKSSRRIISPLETLFAIIQYNSIPAGANTNIVSSVLLKIS